MQMSFYLMCPRRMWLALFRLCQCLSTSGPDQSSTWCPIRVVLLAMCAVKKKKKPSSLQLCNIVCESVFSVWIQAQLCMRQCSVAWLKKKNKTIYYFMHPVSFACCLCRLCSIMKLSVAVVQLFLSYSELTNTDTVILTSCFLLLWHFHYFYLSL